jgi:predicted membrane channel-forming protein YqfA (hemolysin III family)
MIFNWKWQLLGLENIYAYGFNKLSLFEIVFFCHEFSAFHFQAYSHGQRDAGHFSIYMFLVSSVIPLELYLFLFNLLQTKD